MEPYSKIPLWLELSGLPEALNKAANSPAAWSVFCKIASLDCQRNPIAPAPVAISLRDLARACGISAPAAEKVLRSAQKKGWVACFIPDNEEEEGLFQIKTPIPTPQSPEQVRREHPNLFPDPSSPLRYELSGPDASLESPDDPVLQEIIDLYFNSISMKINNIILDELRLVRKRFDMPSIRRIFYRSKAHGITTLGRVVRDLHREAARKALAKEKKSDSVPDSQ